MKIYYWSPFFSNIATEKAVINSIDSINRYSNKKISASLLETIGEWKNQEKKILEKKINVKRISDFNLIKYLPKFGFIKSRISYLVVFLFTVYKLHRFLKTEKPDFLIIHLMTFIPLILLLFFNYKTKFILRISGFPKLNFLRINFWKFVGKKIFLITTPTKTTLELLQSSRIFDFDQLKYLPDPILDVKEIEKMKKEESFIEKEISKKKTIISIGRLTKQKNFQFLINAFSIIQKKNSELNLCILGEGEDRTKLERQIKNLDLTDKVFLLGNKKNIYNYLKNSDIFILPSLWEDPGFVLIEAGYMNKLIISSDCPNGPKELLENGKNGFLFKSNSLDNFLSEFNNLKNCDENIIKNKKISFKKKIKEFTLLNHYKVLKSILIPNEN